jgi:glycosyltransferase involved in cell wall biosynthesis
MRCLIVVPSLTRAGAETQAIDLANGLCARGHRVHLCSFERQLDQRERLASQVRFHHVLRKRKYDVSVIAAIAGIIDAERIDIVMGVLQFAVLIAWLAARRSNRRPPVVAGVHTTINRGIKQELQDRLIYRHLLKRLPAIVFVCDYQRRYWIARYPELQRLARVVHNGVEAERFRRPEFETAARQLRADLRIPESAFVFACIAGFRPEKGHSLLVEAFSRVPSNAHLILAGDGAGRGAIAAMVRDKGLADRVHFLGAIPDVRTLIVASNATVLASIAVETFSMAMLESMALGVPLIASRIGGLPEAITHGETGLLFPIGDVDALAAGMTRMVEQQSEVATMGQAAARLIRTSFTLHRMIEGHEEVLQGALS